MTKYKLCRSCLNKEIDWQQGGIICGLTKAPPDYVETCPDYLADPEKAQKIEETNQANEQYRKGSNAFMLSLAIFLAVQFLTGLYHYSSFGGRTLSGMNYDYPNWSIYFIYIPLLSIVLYLLTGYGNLIAKILVLGYLLVYLYMYMQLIRGDHDLADLLFIFMILTAYPYFIYTLGFNQTVRQFIRGLKD